jgi:hypothetical protein
VSGTPGLDHVDASSPRRDSGATARATVRGGSAGKWRSGDRGPR